MPFSGNEGREPNDPRGLLDLWRLWYQVLLASPLGALMAGSQNVMAKFMRADNAQPDAFSDADLTQFTAALAEPHRARASSQMYSRFFTEMKLGLNSRSPDLKVLAGWSFKAR